MEQKRTWVTWHIIKRSSRSPSKSKFSKKRKKSWQTRSFTSLRWKRRKIMPRWSKSTSKSNKNFKMKRSRQRLRSLWSKKNRRSNFRRLTKPNKFRLTLPLIACQSSICRVKIRIFRHQWATASLWSSLRTLSNQTLTTLVRSMKILTLTRVYRSKRKKFP